MNKDIFSIDDIILQILKYLPRQGTLPILLTNKACFLTAQRHSVEILYSRAYCCDSINLMLWSIDMGSGLDNKRSRVCEYACRAGSLEVLRWALEQDFFSSSRLFNAAAAGGHTHILDFLISDASTSSLLDYEACELSAVLGGNSECIEWVRSRQPHRPYGPSVLAAALQSGNIGILMSLLTNTEESCSWGSVLESAVTSYYERPWSLRVKVLFRSHMDTFLSSPAVQHIDTQNPNSLYFLWTTWIVFLYEACSRENLLHCTLPSLLSYMHPPVWVQYCRRRSMGVVLVYSNGKIEIVCSDHTLISPRAGGGSFVYSPQRGATEVYTRPSDTEVTFPVALSRKVRMLDRYIRDLQAIDNPQHAVATVFERLEGEGDKMEGTTDTTCLTKKVYYSHRSRSIRLIIRFDDCLQMNFIDGSTLIRSYNPLHVYSICYVRNRNSHRHFFTPEGAQSKFVVVVYDTLKCYST